MENNMENRVQNNAGNDTKIKLQCPHCSAKLVVKYQQGIEKLNITCPVCHEKSPYRAYKNPEIFKKNLDDENNKDNTKYKDSTQYKDSTTHPTDETLVKNLKNLSLGKIVSNEKPNIEYRLKPGMNVIGRKASTSQADIQISVEDGMRISREHLKINVKKTDSGYKHYASLYKQKVNDTFVNETQLNYGDCIILTHGDLIKFPGATFKFEISDDEATNI